MAMTQPAWVSAAALQGTLAAPCHKISACTCTPDHEKRLALATAVAKQHIALGLAPQHTRALRVAPSCEVRLQDVDTALAKQTQRMAQLLEQQSLQIQAQQEALQKLQQRSEPTAKARQPAGVSRSTSSNTTQHEVAVATGLQSPIPSSEHLNAAGSTAAISHTLQPVSKAAVAATPAEHASDTKQQPSLCYAVHSGHSQASDHAHEQQGVAPLPEMYGRGQLTAGADLTDRQAVSVSAQPELYSALYAAVAAIVQQAGVPQLQLPQDSVANTGSQTQPVSDGQQQDIRHDSTGLTASAEHQQQGQFDAIRADVCEDARNVLAEGPIGRAVGGTEGSGQTEGRKGDADGQLQAWQSQMQQAMGVLQATLHASGRASGQHDPADPGSAPTNPALPSAHAPTPKPVSPDAHPLTHEAASLPAGAHHGDGYAAAGESHSIDAEASWPQAWPQYPDAQGAIGHRQQPGSMPLSTSQRALQGHDQHRRCNHEAANRCGAGQASSAGRHQQQSNQAGRSSLCTGAMAQQADRVEDKQWFECGQGRWQSPVQSPGQHQLPEKKLGSVQRRLYKGGPLIPKPAPAGRRGAAARRRPRPDWDDQLLRSNPKSPGGFDGGVDGGIGSFSPRPTAKELLQEALARIQNVSSPRPQHAKRQRKCLPPQQPAGPRQPPATAEGSKPQLWNDTEGQHQQNGGHSSSTQAAAARRPARAGSVHDGKQQPTAAIATPTASKQAMVKHHAFGGKPVWVNKASSSVQGAQQNMQSAHPEQSSAEQEGANTEQEAEEAIPDFEDPDKAKAWQKLTHLQQRMVGLISAVEGQLRLSHSPEPAQDAIATSEYQATAAATDSISKGRSVDHRLADAVATQLVLAGHSDGHLPQQSGRDHADGSQGCLNTPGNLQEGGQAPTAAAASAAEQASAQEATSADAQPAAEEAAGLLAVTVHDGHQRALGVAGLKGSLVDPQPLIAAVQANQLGPASSALLDGDVHRILAHRRAYLKQQRAFDRACVGTEHFEFDPTQVVESIADMLLDDVLQQSAAELGTACDSLAEELFESEFVVESTKPCVC